MHRSKLNSAKAIRRLVGFVAFSGVLITLASSAGCEEGSATAQLTAIKQLQTERCSIMCPPMVRPR